MPTCKHRVRRPRDCRRARPPGVLRQRLFDELVGSSLPARYAWFGKPRDPRIREEGDTNPTKSSNGIAAQLLLRNNNTNAWSFQFTLFISSKIGCTAVLVQAPAIGYFGQLSLASRGDRDWRFARRCVREKWRVELVFPTPVEPTQPGKWSELPSCAGSPPPCLTRPLSGFKQD